MKISTRLQISAVVALILAIFLSWVIIDSFIQVNATIKNSTVINQIIKSTFDLNSLTLDYVMQPTERAESQWLAKHKEIRILMNQLSVTDSEAEEIRDRIQANHEKLNVAFRRLITLRAKTEQTPTRADQDLQAQLVGELSVELRSIISGASQLSSKTQDEILTTQKRASQLTVTAIIVLVVTIIGLALWSNLTLVRSIYRLVNTANSIAWGNLESRNEIIESRDEIGRLGYAIRKMANYLVDANQHLNERFEDIQRAELALRESESRYRQAIMAADAVPYSLDYLSNRYTFMGEGILLMTGYAHDEITPALFHDLIREEIMRGQLSDKASDQASQMVRDGSIDEWLCDFRIQTSSGEERWISDSAIQVRDEQGDVVGSIGILQDITDRKRAEAEVLALNASLEQRVDERTAELRAAVRELESFTYTVSHDLRAPLRGINGFARILMLDHASELTAESREYLDKIQRNAKTMGQLVDALLEYSRLGRGSLKKQTVNLRSIVDEVLQLTKNDDHAPTLDIQISDLPFCQGDPSLLHQVMLNLISNAIKFTRMREVARIEIGAMAQDGKTTYFVKDNGVGFDMKYVGKVFGVFQRLHGEEQFEGTGVGLAIVHRIIEKHGGRIWVDAAENKGASFYFTLE